MFKKIAAIVLSFALLAVSLWMVPTAGATSGATTLVQDFEDYDTTTYASRLIKYSLYTSNGTDGNAHSGSKSIYWSTEQTTFGVSLFPDVTTHSVVEGKRYELKFWVKIASAVQNTGVLQLAYSTDKNNANSSTNLLSTKTFAAIFKEVGQASTNVDTSNVGEWQEITLTFTAAHNAYLCFVGYNSAAGALEYYLDDITLTEVAKTTVSFKTNNSLILSDIENYPGEALTLPAPTAKTGKVFEGWYTDPELTNKFTDTVQPDEDTVLYANWVTSTQGWMQDFETWNTTLDNHNTNNNASLTGVTDTSAIAVETVDDTVGYAVHYNNSDATKDIRIVVNFAADKALINTFLTAGDTMLVKFKYKVISGTAELANMIGQGDSKNPSTGDYKYVSGYQGISLADTSGEWKTATAYYTVANPDSMNLVSLVLNLKGAAELYIDDVEVYNANNPGIATDANGYGAIRAASTDKKQGVRGYHAIDKDWFADRDIVEFGLLAVRAERLEGAELNLDAVGTAVQAVVWNKTTKPKATLWDINDHEYVFTSVLTGIIPGYYGSAYYVRTYAKDASGNVIYGDLAQYTVYEVVYAVLNAENPDPVDYAAAESVKNEDAAAYEAWVTANKAS